MILVKTPLRISLVGGGSDLRSFYENHGPGAVVSFAISKYVYTIVNHKFDGRVRVSYSMTENVDNADQVQHDLARECLKRMGISRGIEIVSVADIPGSGTGLGSSSAYTVGLLNALNQYRILYNGSDFEPIHDVAEEACQIEIDRCGKPIGKQDQYAVAYGGLNYFQFYKFGNVVIEKIPLDGIKEKMESHMLLFWTGITRQSKDILSRQAKIKTPSKIQSLKKMSDFAGYVTDSLKEGDFSRIGEMLHENWMLKESLVDIISTPETVVWYNKAWNAGAQGGKLCGAGGGGFLLFWAPPDKHEAIKKAVGLRHIPFKIDPRGTRIAYMTGLHE